MTYEKIGQIIILLYILEQVKHLGLYRYIQCGYGLITDDELRPQGYGPGYAYPGSNTKFNAIALSPEEMKDPQIFRDLGWDLDVVWQLEEGDISPSLRS